MMEGQNLVGDSQISDRAQPIGDGLKVVGGVVDVIQAAGGGGVYMELGTGEGIGALSKKKRGRPPKGQVRPPPAKKNKEVEEEEDVCFICFDGGSLVLCDRRGCPKAYHPACIKRDEAFFESAAKWNCGWHICSMCEKPSHHMCYTCTYSLCRSCIRKSDYVCVRGDRGFCTICMKTIMLIENNGQGEDGKVQADFDDKLSWEYLFKVYWVYLKGKLSLTLDELTQAKNPWRIATTTTAISTISPPPTTAITPPPPPQQQQPPPPQQQPPPPPQQQPPPPPPPPPPTATTSTPTFYDHLEAMESKRRKIVGHVHTNTIPHKEPVITEKPLTKKAESQSTVGSKDWATKELLDFVSHMKNGNTSVLSRVDVQALLMEYIKQNNLRDPKKKNQILCDSRLKNLFGKPRVGHIEMLTHLEYHFFIEEDLCKTTVNHTVNNTVNHTVNHIVDNTVDHTVNKSAAVLDDPDWTDESKVNVVKDKKRRKRSKNGGEEQEQEQEKEKERVVKNKLDEFGAIDVHNINLIYLRRDLMEKLLEDTGSFREKVVGSIVRIRITGSNDMYRLVKVVGTSKVDVMYKVDGKLTDVMLEVLNLDKKETISIDTVSDQEFTEEECRRLQQSIKCGLAKHFTVGEIQEKAVALQPVRLDDWMEKEILRLNHLRDVANEKGHRKGYRECVEKLQLLKTLDEREHRLQEIPEVHSDPKMNPHYESDDTEEYFNKEHGDHMESKYSGVKMKNSRSPKKRTGPFKLPNLEEQCTTKNAPGKSEHEIDCNGCSTITKVDNQATLSSSISNNVQETIPPSSVPIKNTAFSLNELLWHYLDPNGKVQGPFSIIQLQKWSTTGYFPDDMRVWANHEDKSVILNDLLKEQFDNNHGNEDENVIPLNTDCNQTEGSTIPIPIPVPVPIPIPIPVPSSTAAPIPVNHEKLSGYGQNWNANKFNSTSAASLTMSNESTGNLNSGDAPRESEQELTGSKDPETSVVELPGPVPKKEEDEKPESVPESKIPIPDPGNPPSWSSASSLVVGNGKLPDGWGGKREEWESVKPTDHVATPTSNIDQNIDQHNDQNAHQTNDLPTWQGMAEMIEFSTLAEESVSDLLAEVDAMESQYGLPSPTSRRNSFVDDLFNGSFDEFSPTPDQGTRSDGFSSSGDIQQLPCHATTPDDHHHLVGFDFMKMSQNPFIAPQTSNHNQNHNQSSGNVSGGFKWPESEGMMIDINRSARAESDDVDFETKVNNNVEKMKVNENYFPSEVMRAPKSTFPAREEEEEGEFIQPEPPQPPLTLGLDFGSEKYGGERYYDSSDRGHHNVEDTGYSRSSRSSWNNKQSILGSSGGGYSRPPTKGQKVCRFYESGRCKKGASCKNLHP